MKIYFNEITSGYLTKDELEAMIEGLIDGVADKRPLKSIRARYELWRNARKFLDTFIHEIFDTTESNRDFSAYNEGYSYRDQFIKERYGEEK